MITDPVTYLEDCVPKSYPPEFRRRVLALVEADRPVAQVAAELGISGQAIYGWLRQQLIDSCQLPGLPAPSTQSLWPRKRIAKLEAELTIHRRVAE
jgi:transposase-like protein